MNEPKRTDIRLRAMRESDFPDCQILREQAGWNQTLIDWQRFHSYNPEGCFVAMQGRRLVGTACTIAYEDRFGWISMVIVHRDCQRMGIGTLLLNAGIEHLEQRGLTVKLDATPAGKMLYDTLGFHDEYGAARMDCANIFVPMGLADCPPLLKTDLDALNEYDRRIFGASRKPVLQSYLHYYPQFAFCVHEDERFKGYIMAREGVHAFHIGPWVADDAIIAKRLLVSLIEKRRPSRVFIDIVLPNPQVRSMLESMGFKEQRPFIRMFKGNNHHPGNPQWVYGLSGPELG